MIFVGPDGYDKTILFSILGLTLYGTLMIGSSSMGQSVDDFNYLVVTIIKQICFVIIGFISMNVIANVFTISFVKSNRLLSLIVVTIISLILCLLFGPVNGARAWIRLPLGITEISIQPSEFAKITTILIIAGYCGDVKKKFHRDCDLIGRPIGLIVIICLIVHIFQRDFGSMTVIAMISIQCFLIPSNNQIKGLQKVIKIGLVLLAFGAMYLFSPYGESMVEKLPFMLDYQKKRMLSAIDPFYDPYNTGYQLIKGLTSIATGGWFGKGFGNSVNKYTDFPAANTDYILAILIEELGFAGFMTLLMLYAVIIIKLFFYALRIRKESSRIILIGTATYLLIHLSLNIGGVTGLIPLTGVPLLMISSGGSATISFMVAIGICQAIISSYNRESSVGQEKANLRKKKRYRIKRKVVFPKSENAKDIMTM